VDLATRYSELFGYAQTAAERVVANPQRPETAHAVRLHAAALTILAVPPRPLEGLEVARSAAHDVLDVLADGWPLLATGHVEGADLLRARPGLWHRLMTEWPMIQYADLLLATVSSVHRDGHRILEVGSGVGSATRRLSTMYGNRLVWSDREPSIVRNGDWPGTGRLFDFDREPPEDLGLFGTIVASNALHCAADIERTAGLLRRLLVPGGTLLIAEGCSPTRADGTPWALDLLFHAFRGWWNRTGFLSRPEWCDILSTQGYTRIAHTILAAGDDDLGGVICATNPG
jgi:long-chain acyl-CoA synthetase